jgi:hypothetical protein
MGILPILAALILSSSGDGALTQGQEDNKISFRLQILITLLFSIPITNSSGKKENSKDSHH